MYDYRLVYIKTSVTNKLVPSEVRVLDTWPHESEEYGDSFYRRTFILSYYKGFFYESDEEVSTHFEIQRSFASKNEWMFFCPAYTQQSDSESWDE
jgi:hypothetical protein